MLLTRVDAIECGAPTQYGEPVPDVVRVKADVVDYTIKDGFAFCDASAVNGYRTDEGVAKGRGEDPQMCTDRMEARS